MIYAVFVIAVMALYILLISRFIKGWNELSNFETLKMPSQIPVTIITAFKNEEKILPLLAQALENQTYQNFEWILVDDGSTDTSVETLHSIISNGMFGVKVLENNGKGKKNAIKTAIYNAKNEWIITLDADCIPDENWLLNIVAYQEKYPSDLLICPVKMDKDKTIWQKFQQFEFASLIASGAGASKRGMPIMCNGANLGFKKAEWLKSETKLRFKELSGDDIYLLQAIKKRNGVIRFIKSTNATVITRQSDTLLKFLQQRKRWAGKKALFMDFDLFITAFLVLLASGVVITTVPLAIFYDYYPSLLSLIFLSKLGVDSYLFLEIKDFFGLKRVLLFVLLFSIFYPIYIVFTGIASVFVRNKW